LSDVYSSEKLLLKVINDLSDFLPCLVLVGGWVPYVYAKYVWRNISGLPVTTSDIDFGVIGKKYEGKESIASRVRKLGYGERHVSMDRLIPFVPIVKGEDSAKKAEVEFIIDQEAPKDIKEKIVGKEIKINEICQFNILLESIIKIDIGACPLQIPTEPMFIFHKFLTFVQRENKDKLKKDLYYTYYMIRFSPERETLVKAVKLLISNRNEGKKVKENIRAYFDNIDSEGPVLVEQENAPDSFVSDVRKDAYERIRQLLV